MSGNRFFTVHGISRNRDGNIHGALTLTTANSADEAVGIHVKMEAENGRHQQNNPTATDITDMVREFVRSSPDPTP